tara:strand:- start:200 stop:424 length:225 start_codon:yes stop_codon:yes gene_type:complete
MSKYRIKVINEEIFIPQVNIVWFFWADITVDFYPEPPSHRGDEPSRHGSKQRAEELINIYKEQHEDKLIKYIKA